MCVAWISKQTAIISLYSIILSVFITEAESFYCAVRTGSLNQTDTLSSLKEKRRISKFPIIKNLTLDKTVSQIHSYVTYGYDIHKQIDNLICETSGYQGVEYGGYCLMACDAVQLGKFSKMHQRKILYSFSG